MAINSFNIHTPTTRGPLNAPANVVSMRRSVSAVRYEMTNEIYTPPIIRGVCTCMTVWVQVPSAQDKVILQMCFLPVFNPDGTFNSGASSWAQIGEVIGFSIGVLAKAQTLDDVAYALRVARTNAQGVPTAGNFQVTVWSLGG